MGLESRRTLMSGDTFGALFVLFGLLCAAVFMVLYIVSLVWLYRDSQAHGKTGCMWVLIVWFTWPFGLLAYILLRDRQVIL